MIACGLQLTLEPVHSLPFRSIAIEGPIGVGKTALAERLATRLDAATVLEETDNPFLADFYAGRPGARPPHAGAHRADHRRSLAAQRSRSRP